GAAGRNLPDHRAQLRHPGRGPAVGDGVFHGDRVPPGGAARGEGGPGGAHDGRRSRVPLRDRSPPPHSANALGPARSSTPAGLRGARGAGRRTRATGTRAPARHGRKPPGAPAPPRPPASAGATRVARATPSAGRRPPGRGGPVTPPTGSSPALPGPFLSSRPRSPVLGPRWCP